jgi:hypothetical protein
MNRYATIEPVAESKDLRMPRPVLQRKCACGNDVVAGGACAECERHKLQRKLTIGASDDPLELEAERVADRVLAVPGHSAISPAAPRIQRFSGQATADVAPASVERALGAAGRPLDAPLQEEMEQRFGKDFSRVRVHSGAAAEQSARELNAQAYTAGSNIVFGAGQFAPASQAGRRLLAHELTHVVQQTGPDKPSVERNAEGMMAVASAPSGHVQAKRKAKPLKTVTKITLFVDRGIVVLELDGKSTITLPTVYNGNPPPGTYKVKDHKATPPIGGVANENGWVTEWKYPPDASYKKAKEHTFYVIAGRPGPTEIAADEPGGAGGKQQAGTGAAKGDEGGGVAAGGKGPVASGAAEKTPDDTSAAASSDKSPRLTPSEEAVWRRISALMKGAAQTAAEDPAELVRLFQVLSSVVVDPQFSADSGESWVRFAQFLDRNRDKIEGHLRSSPDGRLTQKVLEKIIADYEKFLASEPAFKHPPALETLADYDKEFRYDPGWQKLSPADRRLLLEYSRMAPGELSDKKIDFTRVTGDMKVGMAIKLADTSLLGEMAEAAKNAFTDPRFLVTLIVTMAIYVGLWLTPDPSWVTKILAGALTVVLLAQFSIDDLYGFAVAWSDLMDDSSRAKSVAELKAAGEKFLKRVGPIGFDIMLFIVMWRIGKRAGPKLSKMGAERGVARAQAKVKAVEARPGSGVPQNVGAKAGDLLSSAKSSAEGTTATQVLNALDKLLPKGAREGLAKFRGKAGDANALKSVEGQAARGSDLGKYLAEQNLPKEAIEVVRAELAHARLKLARARLIEAETIKDPALRETVRDEQYRAVRTILKETGALDSGGIKQALAARDLSALIRALRNSLAQLGEKVSAHETQGAIGESIQRAQLRIKYAGRKGTQFLSNLALVRKLGNFRSLREWVSAEEARIRTQQPKITDEALNREVAKTRVKLMEKDGRVYESLGEVDTLVAEPNAKGTLQPLEIAEVKAGDKPAAEALGQLARIIDGFDRIAQGDRNIKVFEMSGKKALGKELTPRLDLSLAKTIELSTRGPEGKAGFTQGLGFTEAELKGVAESLLKNLPPEKPAPVRPLTSPREKEEAPKPVE